MRNSVYRIPFPDHSEWYIEGTLHTRLPPHTSPDPGRPIALILHGALGHRHYLYQRTLPSHISIDSFAFDFRSNNASTGPPWDYAGFGKDVEDLKVVVRWLKEKGWRVVLVVGHSRGSIVGMKWVVEDEENAHSVTGFANVSGRYRMDKIRDISKHMIPLLSSQGYYDWHHNVAGRPRVARVHVGDIDRFAAYDAASVARKFPGDVHVLTVHGMKDAVVPPYDGAIYARVFERRREEGGKGTSTMYFIEESDHNHKGHYEEVNETISRWWRSVEDGSVRGGWAEPWRPEPGELDDSKSRL